jgi:hypothetical protein
MNHPNVRYFSKQSFEINEGSGGQPYRNAMAASETGYAANMIVVLMGHDDAGDICGDKPKTTEAV